MVGCVGNVEVVEGHDGGEQGRSWASGMRGW